VLYTKVDAESDKLATVVGRTELTRVVTTDVTRRNFSTFRVWDKVPDGSGLLGIRDFSSKYTVYDKSIEPLLPNQLYAIEHTGL